MVSEPLAVIVPRESVNDESVKLLCFHVSDGQLVSEGEVVAEVETSKAVLEIEAPANGFVRIAAKVGTEVAIGNALCYIGATADFSAPSAASKPSAPVKASLLISPTLGLAPLPSVIPPQIGSAVRFTPLAARMAEDAGLGLQDFVGLRIVRSKDVHARLRGTEAASAEPSAPAPVASFPRPAPSVGVPVAWSELPRRKQVEIRQIGGGMSHTLLSSVTHCLTTRGLKVAVQAAGVEGLSSSTVIVFEVARLLRKYPLFNGLYHDGQAGLYEEVNIGLAIDDGSGLMVPVIRNADQKSLHELAAGSRDLLERYISKELGVQDFVGATFTVSDLSGEGVFHFAPLISAGQAAILGVGAEFFVGDGAVGLCNLTLAFDHQLADGRMAARFLKDLGARLSAYEEALGAGSGGAEVKVELYCSLCHRDEAAIRSMDAMLMRSEIPSGYVCSLCLRGF